MKRIKYIAKNELYSLFFSPIAWLLMILFIILTSVDYISTTDSFVRAFQRGGAYLKMMEYLTSAMTTNPLYGFIYRVVSNLYIFLPLITMGLISREMSSGTIKLLHSSPLRVREIVLGKYLAMLFFIFCLMVLLGVILIPFSIELFHPDYSQLLASVFGLFLVLSCYSAIGIFISSLTTYQIVAAIITFALFLLFSKAGGLWQDVDVIRDITYYLDIGGSTSNFISGLLNLRDLCYFMVIIGGFLAFTIIKIKSGTESISWWVKGGRYVAVIAIAFVVGYITSKPAVNMYFDATRNKMLTITPPSQAMLAKLNDGELEVTAYANLFMYYTRFDRTQQNGIIDGVWGPYTRFKPDTKFKFVYYYDLDTSNWRFKTNPGMTLKQIAQKEIEARRGSLKHFLSPGEVNKLVDTKAEGLRSFFVMKYKGKETVVRVFDDAEFWPSENEIDAAINRLIGVPPKIDFVSDEIERGPFSEKLREYKEITSELGNRYALLNQGYDFDTLALKNNEIPAGLTALVIADPRAPISPGNLEKIDRYIDTGGNLFIAGEPDKKEITKSLFDKLGLRLRDGLVVQPSDRYSSDIAYTIMTDSAKNISPQFARETSDDIRFYGDTLLKVALAGASVLDYQEKDGFRIYPLLRTDKDLSWNRLAPLDNDSLQLHLSKLPSDERGSFTTAVRMNRTINGREQRIIVASDADYLSAPQLSGGRRYNYNFGFWCFSYFSYGQFPTNTMRPKSIDNGFSIKADEIPLQKHIFYWIIPVLIGIIASVILIRRKRK